MQWAAKRYLGAESPKVRCHIIMTPPMSLRYCLSWGKNFRVIANNLVQSAVWQGFLLDVVDSLMLDLPQLQMKRKR